MMELIDTRALVLVKEWYLANIGAPQAGPNEKCSLLLLGPPGTGKTIAARYVMDQQRRRYPSRPTGFDRDDCMFVMASELADIGTFTVSDREYYERTRRACTLVIDDLGAEKLTDMAMSRLHALLDFRFSKRWPTVMTSNLSVQEFKERYGLRIVDRIREFASVFILNAESMRGTKQ